MMGTILYVGGLLPDKSAAALRITANSKALREYGYDVVLLGDSKELEINSDIVCKKYQNFDMWISRYPQSALDWLRRLVSIENICSVLSHYPYIDAVVVYDPSAIMFWRLKRYCHKLGIPVIADCAEWHSTAHLSGIKKIIKAADIFLTMRFVQKKADGIIVISRYLENYYKKCRTVRIIPLIDKADSKWNELQHNNDGCRHFVYAGQMDKDKDCLVDIINSLDQVDKKYIFDIVGISRNEYLKNYPNQRDVLDSNKDKIIFNGKVSHIKALEYVKKADFSFLIRESSRKNDAGFPTKFGESIACNTPVIATDFSDIREIIDKYGLGVMVTKETISDVVSSLIDMSDFEYLHYLENCKNCSVFDFHDHVKELGEFVQEMKEYVKSKARK